MSGVTGNQSIKSRLHFKEIVKTYTEILKDFPGFIKCKVSGSFNSNKTKTEFGDVDLILLIDSSIYKDKTLIKTELAKFLTSLSSTVIVPFISEKYNGKRYYNSGEIITVSYKPLNPSITACQVDNIIAISEEEYNFKGNFLDLTASKQGLLLGLVKTALLEQKPSVVFKRLDLDLEPKLEKSKDFDLEYEFNLSSSNLQLRLVKLEKGSFKQIERSTIWKTTDWSIIQLLLNDFNLSLSFDRLLLQCKEKLKMTRSTKRLAGVFKSMISIKSGEVGKQKGQDKQCALDKVQKMFGESTNEFASYLNSLNEKTVGVFSGRFQPCTKKHVQIIEQMSRENDSAIVFLVKGKETSKDKELNPFNEEMQIKMLNKILPNNAEIIVIDTGFFPEELNEMTNNKFVVYSGSDRVKSYEKYNDYMNEGKELSCKEIDRSEDDISATRVREALINDDEDSFKELTDKRIHGMYKELKESILIYMV